MLRRTGIALAVVATTAGLTATPAIAAKHPSGMDVKAGSMHGQVPAKGAKAARPHGGSPLMTWHNGPIMATADVHPIFWGTSWPSYSGDEITGIDRFYQGFGGSNYAKTSDEYSGTGGQVTATTTANTPVVDSSAAPHNGPSVSTILTEVAKVESAIPDTTGNGYYPVYTDTPRGGAQYCAWHSYGTVNGRAYVVAFFFKLDGDPGCDPQSTVSGESQGLAALANVSAHELSEARTDKDAQGGWYDASGAENGDKCAWTFNQTSVALSNGSLWKLQGEWSNAAYTAGTGYANNSGQKGCLDGH